MKTVLKYYRPYIPFVALILLLLFGQAMCELALPGDDPCPLVLDDVLVNLDDERAAMAAGLIRELAETRQILFFTCRARDAALLQG